MAWTENTLEYYAEISPTRTIFGTEILSAMRFKSVWKFIHCCQTSKEYKGFRPADCVILYYAKILGGGGGGIMHYLL